VVRAGHLAVVVLYLATLAAAPLVGLVAGRLTGGAARVVAVASLAAVAAFLLVTAPAAEFLNACHIGRSIVLDTSC
jgi:hypothetical protein